jgi:hypothetical protein
VVELRRIVEILVYVYTIVVGIAKYMNAELVQDISWPWVFIPLWVVVLGPIVMRYVLVLGAGRINSRKNF